MQPSQQPNNLLSTAYAPPNFWMALLLFGEAHLEAQERFQKQTHRNRTQILGPNGVQTLSIPVDGASKNAPIKEVRISYAENWQQVHWRSLEAAYGNAPFWEFLAVELAPLYHFRTDTLWEFNQNLILLFKDWLQVDFVITATTTFEKPTGRAGDYRFQLPKTPLPSYPQLFAEAGNFVPDLSFFDLMFNLGPQSYDYLMALHQTIKQPQNP